MEQTIATLITDFERGRMDRRQLIKSLAALAAIGGAAPAEAQTKAPWKTVHLDHISYAVNDYKKSADFYASLMGWEIANDNGKNQATLRIGNVGEIIIRNARRPEGAPAPSTPSAQPGRPPITGVINHISYGIAPWDTEGVKAELTRRGLNPRDDFQGNDFKSYHVYDPDGWDLQISNQTKVG
jgi:catechol 2,3-dioxygenase-like lactoylglutathione lyase family enzyme